MSLHLNQRDLIEYEFDLAEPGRAEVMSEHLAKCEKCRAKLEKLKRKFSALDMLDAEEDVSDELVAKVVEGAAQRGVTKAGPFGRAAWLRAAAAVLVIGIVILAMNLQKEDSAERLVKAPAASKEQELVERVESLFDREGPVAMKAADEVGRAFGVDIPDEAPFAPASAIELVVLPKRDDVQITIYNSADMTLVRERRNLTLKKGWNWLQFMWANTLIDPTSLSLEPQEKADKIDIQQLVYPARLKDIGRWLIRSEIEGQVPFEITYFTSGLSWRAFYMGTLTEDEREMNLKGYVRVMNQSGEDYENAQTRLIVGEIHLLDKIVELARRQYPYGGPVEKGLRTDTFSYGDQAGIKSEDGKVQFLGDVPFLGKIDRDFRNGYAYLYFPKEIKKEGLSEYFLYTIEGTETIADKWARRLESFDVDGIPVESLYKYDEQRWGAETIRFVKFVNDAEHELGQTPMPDGNVKIYRTADESGHLSYVGGANVKYIPVDEEVELNLDTARLVKVAPKLMELRTENYEFDDDRNVAGWDEVRTWKIEITNTRQLPVEIEITRGFGTAYWTLKTEDEYKKHDAEHARFELTVEPGSKRELIYTVTTYHGRRREGR